MTDGGNTFAARHVVKGFETVEEGEVTPPGTVTAGADAASVAPGGTVVITVLTNDAATPPRTLNPASIVIVTPPTAGTVTGTTPRLLKTQPSATRSKTSRYRPSPEGAVRRPT